MSSSQPRQSITARIIGRTFVSLAATLLTLAALIFWPAADIEWRQGWIFLLIFAVLVGISVGYLWFANPEIFVARSKIQKGTKSWDKAMMVFLLGSLVAIFPLAGLDHRWHWSAMPNWLTILGFALFSLGFIASIWVYRVNKFAELGVRIQTERGHKVIDTGPYVIVRHPLYLASLILIIGTPLALNSYWALIPAGVGTIVLGVRTAWEDRLLYEELEGYKEYASRVRYRLIPGVW